jgi:hypothetical protein
MEIENVRNQSLQDSVTNTARTDGPNDLPFQIPGMAGDVRHLPVSALNHLVSRHEVAHKALKASAIKLLTGSGYVQQNRHHDMLSNRHNIRARNF